MSREARLLIISWGFDEDRVEEKGMLEGKRSLTELCSQPPILEFEGFVLRPFDGWHLFLEHPNGEGTTVRRAEFLNALAKMFERNF